MGNEALGLMGLALRGGLLALGEDPVGQACGEKRARLVLLAADAAENTRRRGEQNAQRGGCPCLTTRFSRAELGGAAGRESCAVAAFTDAGMAAAFCRRLAQADPEGYGPLAEELTRKAERKQARRRARQAREKEAARRSRKPWAPPPEKP